MENNTFRCVIPSWNVIWTTHIMENNNNTELYYNNNTELDIMLPSPFLKRLYSKWALSIDILGW